MVGITAGYCFAGNAAILGCCDVVIATEDSNIGMGGPAMIEGGGLGVFAPKEVGTIEVLRRSARERPPLDPVLNPPESWRLAPRWLAAVRERAYVGSRRGQARPSSDRAV